MWHTGEVQTKNIGSILHLSDKILQLVRSNVWIKAECAPFGRRRFHFVESVSRSRAKNLRLWQDSALKCNWLSGHGNAEFSQKWLVNLRHSVDNGAQFVEVNSGRMGGLEEHFTLHIDVDLVVGEKLIGHEATHLHGNVSFFARGQHQWQHLHFNVVSCFEEIGNGDGFARFISEFVLGRSSHDDLLNGVADFAIRMGSVHFQVAQDMIGIVKLKVGRFTAILNAGQVTDIVVQIGIVWPLVFSGVGGRNNAGRL